MKFADLISALGDIQLEQDFPADLEIKGLAYDSRRVQEGYLFAAISGALADGHAYVPQALAKGAAALITERFLEGVPPHIPQIVTPNSRSLMSRLAGIFAGHPEDDLYLVGVTGTNGKTTVTYILKWLWECAGMKSGLVGTIHNAIGEEILPTQHTTPESLELFELFSKMKAAGCQNAVMEVSSHSLKQGRAAGCHFDAAIFTNLSQDHLDYHLTWEDYAQSKALLFQMLQPQAGAKRFALINQDDAQGAFMAAHCRVPVYFYGMSEGCHFQAADYRATPRGTSFKLRHQGKEYEAELPLIGRFNMYNALAALGAAAGQGLALEDCLAWLKETPQVAGRFELVNAGQDFTVVVDYAHTPDGLLNVLSAAKELNPRRLITVFGCGGDRDRLKRPIMAGIAADYSDFIVLTSDNPRTENPFSILDQIEAGLAGKSYPYEKIESRRLAIARALKQAQKGDIVVIAGKGHENYQIVGEQVLHFDDKEVAREILQELVSAKPI